MPIRKCCCGPCETFEENFCREDDDVTLLADHWEVCGDWTDWFLTDLGPEPDTNCRLENNVAGAKLVLKEMVGNPYGILRVHIQIIPGATYRVHVFHGDVDNACSGEHTVVEVECGPDPDEGTLRILNGATEEAFVEFSGVADDDLEICAGSGIIEATLTSADETVRHCETAGGYWFALEGVTHPDNPDEEATQWSDLWYSDHWEHDKRCPKCSRHCCFPDHDGAITGFDVTIHGIEDGSGSGCECDEQTSEFRLILNTIPDTQDKCDCLLYYSIDGTEGSIDGPHACGITPYSIPSIQIGDCRVDGSIYFLFSLLPLHSSEGDVIFDTTFAAGTAPDAIASAHLDINPTGIGDGRSCVYDNAWIEFTPLVVDGCCEEYIEPMALMSHKAVNVPDKRALRAQKAKEKQQLDSRLINWIKWFRHPEDKGVGDTVERLLAKAGGRKIKRLLESINIGCGCTNRQKKMNKKWPYDKNSK